MSDLRSRFRTLDEVPTPNLWVEIEQRAVAARPVPSRLPWLLIAVTLLLASAIGGSILIGAGILKLPAVEISPHPSSTPVEAAAPTWTATRSMLGVRGAQTATLLSDGRVLVAGGTSESGSGDTNPLATAELYDPSSRTWIATGSMGTPRDAATATLLPGGKVLVAGGADGIAVPTNVLASAELYDPASGTWTATGTMGTPRATATATLLPDGRVLVAGGLDGHNAGASAELYDPTTGTWTATGSMRDARFGHTATLLPNGRVLVVGGFHGERIALASAELYDLASGTWIATGSLSQARLLGHTATLLANGKVLVTGGESGTGWLATCELYDPASGTWTATGTMGTPRAIATATLLPDGRVLVAGGLDLNNTLASAELYDPTSGTWTATGSMGQGRFGHTATLLPDGSVLVSGGYGAASNGRRSLASAELYGPGGGS
jgi:N-acetylneuraminic acid mutarotase